jgi:hypothetical protein
MVSNRQRKQLGILGTRNILVSISFLERRFCWNWPLQMKNVALFCICGENRSDSIYIYIYRWNGGEACVKARAFFWNVLVVCANEKSWFFAWGGVLMTWWMSGACFFAHHADKKQDKRHICLFCTPSSQLVYIFIFCVCLTSVFSSPVNFFEM